MKIREHTIIELRDPSTRRALCGSTELVADGSLAAQGENPRALPGDIALLTAEHESRIVGVLGVIPDWIHGSDGRHRFGWMHNWNASSDSGTAGALLFLAAARRYAGSIGVAGSTPVAERVYLGSKKLVELRTKRGASFFFRTNLRRDLPPRLPKARRLEPILRAADAGLNAALGLRTARWKRRADLAGALHTVELLTIDEPTHRFIETVRWPELFRRGGDELNWIRHFTGQTSAASGVTPTRDHVFLRIHDERGAIVGLVHLTVRDETMKVPYFFCAEASVLIVARAVLEACIDRKVRDLLVYSEALATAVASLAVPCWTIRQRSKLFLIGTRLASCAGSQRLYVQDGDGDGFL